MERLEKPLLWVILTLFILMIALVSLQVINRYFFQLSIPWTEELTRTSYLLMIYVGSVLAVIQNNHIRITIIERRLPTMVRRVIWIAASLISAIFFAVVAFGNYTYALINWGSRFPTMPWLTVGYVMAVVLVCSVFMAILFFLNVFKPVPTDPVIEIGDL